MAARSKEHGIASRKNVAFLVRRARLLLGETQSEFADHFGVETSTVSRWERGLVKPLPKALAEITKMATRVDPFRSEDIIMASPVFKYLAALDDLTTPLMVSKGFTRYLVEVGYTFEDFLNRQTKDLWARPGESIYEVSVSHCLREIENDPRWSRGEIAFAEFRGFAKALNVNAWVRGLVAPLPDKGDVVLFEAVVDRSQVDGTITKLVPVHRYGPQHGNRDPPLQCGGLSESGSDACLPAADDIFLDDLQVGAPSALVGGDLPPRHATGAYTENPSSAATRLRGNRCDLHSASLFAKSLCLLYG